jgi:uncharacterized protein (DUF2267 family)
MPLNFEKYAAKGNEFINALEQELGNRGRDHAARVLKSVFRALRNRLSVNESMQFASQLPMALKSVYIDGWKPGKKQKRIQTLDDFANEVIHEDGLTAWRDFSSKEEAVMAIRAVMKTLSNYVSTGEMMDIATVFPMSMKEEVNSWIEEINKNS